MPVLELTTTGRKTGRRRSVMLTSPVQEGTTLVVVASRGGDDKSPAWFLNLQDNAEVGVTLQGKPEQRMRARVATPEERARLWPRVIADHKNYAEYQTRTNREIPLVLLEPERPPRPSPHASARDFGDDGHRDRKGGGVGEPHTEHEHDTLRQVTFIEGRHV